jgi:hypothetical protein
MTYDSEIEPFLEIARNKCLGMLVTSPILPLISAFVGSQFTTLHAYRLSTSFVPLQGKLVSALPIPVPSMPHQWRMVSPGGNSIRILYAPAAATSTARFT